MVGRAEYGEGQKALVLVFLAVMMEGDTFFKGSGGTRGGELQ